MEANGTATAYATYRGSDVDGDMAPALRLAIEAHRRHYGRDPVGLVVNKIHVAKARAALADLEMATLLLDTSGGCLVWEIWLMVATNGQGPRQDAPEPGGGQVGAGGDGQRPASLSARAEKARQEMTPERALQLALSFEEVAR